MKKNSNYTGTNIILDSEGRTYHLGIKTGDIASNIILVGEKERAKIVSKYLTNVQHVGKVHRNFYSYTGEHQGRPISVISIGMGMPMVDFAIREICQVSTGDLNIVRMGTCGTVNPEISVGTVSLVNRSILVQTNYEYFHLKKNIQPYHMVESSYKVCNQFLRNLTNQFEKCALSYHVGTDITCEEFFATQGRIDSNFNDANENLINNILKNYSNISCLQMETFKMFDLASRVKGRNIKVMAACLILAQRNSNIFLSRTKKIKLEHKIAQSIVNCFD